MKTLNQANKRVEQARNTYRNYIKQYCDNAGSMEKAAIQLGQSPDYIRAIMRRNNFSALKKLANKIEGQNENRM